MDSDLYQWYPVRKGLKLPRKDWMVLARHTSADGDVYVGRNAEHEVGELTQKDHLMNNIRCHAHGKATDGYALVLRPKSRVEWKAFNRNDSLPLGAVCSGVTKKDGKVYVARDDQHRVGKLNVDGSLINNLWVPWDNLFSISNLARPLKQGEILIVSPGEQSSDLRWDPDAQCGEHNAKDRVAYLKEHEHLRGDLAKWLVMSEYQEEFSQNRGWNPDAMCGGHKADARSKFLQKESKISEAEAQQQVMKEFPESFAQSRSSKRTELSESQPGWHPDTMCGDYKAGARSEFLQKEKQISEAEAQQQVMKEFPESFAQNCGHKRSDCPPQSQRIWNPTAMCGGHKADARSKFLQKESKISEAEAQQQVMEEFPEFFAQNSGRKNSELPPESQPARNPDAMYDRHTAEAQEIRHRPSQPQLTWNPNAHCGGRMADARARFLQKEEGMSEVLAQQQVMSEFPGSFAPSQSKSEEIFQREQQSEFLKVVLAIVGAISAMCYLFADDLLESAHEYSLAAGLFIFLLSLILLKALEFYPQEGRKVIGFALRLCGQDGMLGDASEGSQQELQILKNEFQRVIAAAMVSILAVCYLKKEFLISLARAHPIATSLILVVIGRLLFKVFETIPEESRTAMEAASQLLASSS